MDPNNEYRSGGGHYQFFMSERGCHTKGMTEFRMQIQVIINIAELRPVIVLHRLRTMKLLHGADSKA